MSTIATLTSDNQLREAVAVHHAVHGDPEPIWGELLYRHPRWSATGAHRAVIDDDRIVALTSVAMWEHRFGDAILPAGEIGLVGTLSDRRNQGYSRALMESWLETMRAERIPLSFLIGIPNYYERWDYHYAAPDHANHFLSIGRDALARCAVSGASRRPVDAARDIPAILDLIAAEMRHTAGSPALDATLLRYFVDRAAAHGVDWHVVEGDDGDVSGVIRTKRWTGGTGPQAAGAIALVATRDDHARSAIAAVMLDHLAQGERDELPLAIAPHGPFARWLYQRGACRRSDRSIYPGGYAAMYRVNDLPTVLEAVHTTWDDREITRHLAGTAVTLRTGSDETQVATLEVTQEEIEIHPGPGGVETDAPPAVSVPWVTGWRSAADWLDGTPFPPLPGRTFDRGEPETLPPDARNLLSMLFPRRHPYVGDTIQGA
ncbi:MAG TPA: GNAT family N-acetyltransferase [Thermomicrobiales bacterium]|nr:GNAT family N-acetyltransferase [Thermomicrobiales bacterium]